MLKRWIVPLLLFFAMSVSPLYANELFDTFIVKQIEVEKKFLDSNLSSNDVEALIDEQNRDYRSFFLELISKNANDLKISNIYVNEMAILQRRMKVNKQRNNTKAYVRDEIKLNTYTLLNNIRMTFYDVLQATDADTKKIFYQKIDQIVATRHENEILIHKENYLFLQQSDDVSDIVTRIRENLLENELVLNIHNTVSSELARFKEPMYDAVRLSSFGLVSLGYKINTSAVGNTINSYLSWSGLDSAKIIFIFMILLGVYGFRKIIVALSGTLLKNFFEKSDDISYIIESVSGVFGAILIVITLDIVMKIYAGFTDVMWVDLAFGVVYTILLTYLVHRLVNAVATIKMERLRSTMYLRHEVINLGMRVVNVIIYIIGFIVILNLFNVDLTAILSGLGIGGFAVAFAAKDTIANFFGSVSILVGDLFEQGDWIEVDDYEGSVVEIGLRGTTIRTFDNAMIAIPNFKLADSGIRNWSRRQLGRRIKMHIGVTYESDFKDINNAVKEIREMLIHHKQIANTVEEVAYSERYARLVSKEDYKGIKQNILVYMDRFSESSIDILVYCFSKSVIWNEWLEVKEDVMYKIAAILEKNSLSFAYPTMAIHRIESKDER